jgi:hypothetical protein
MAAARTARARPQIREHPLRQPGRRARVFAATSYLIVSIWTVIGTRRQSSCPTRAPPAAGARASVASATASPSESGRADWYWHRCVVQPAHDEAAGHVRQQQHPHELAMYSIEYTIGRAKPYRARSTRLTAPCSPRREQLNHGIVPLTRRRPAAPPTSCSRQIRAFPRRRHSTRGIWGKVDQDFLGVQSGFALGCGDLVATRFAWRSLLGARETPRIRNQQEDENGAPDLSGRTSTRVPSPVSSAGSGGHRRYWTRRIGRTLRHRRAPGRVLGSL